MRIYAKLEWFPDDHWTIRGDVNKTWGESFAERVKSALLGITDPELLAPFPRKRFVPTNNAEYQPIEDTAKAIGLLDSP